jgi:hypothetical protein
VGGQVFDELRGARAGEGYVAVPALALLGEQPARDKSAEVLAGGRRDHSGRLAGGPGAAVHQGRERIAGAFAFVSYHRFSMRYGRFGDCRNMRGGLAADASGQDRRLALLEGVIPYFSRPLIVRSPALIAPTWTDAKGRWGVIDDMRMGPYARWLAGHGAVAHAEGWERSFANDLLGAGVH